MPLYGIAVLRMPMISEAPSSMSFRVANVIATFNSKSGGPPRTVSLIAAAGVGQWRADLFTTTYRESKSDSLLLDEFPGHVNVLSSHWHTIAGGLCMMTGISASYRVQLLKGVVPDIVHIHGMWSPFLAAFAESAIKNRIPIVVAPHGMLEPWSMSVRRFRKTLALKSYQGRILAHASAIHATSELEAENLRRLNISSAPVFVVPNVVQEPSIRVADEDSPKPSKRVLLFLSRVHEKKGLGILLRAWNEIRPADWSLLIVGSGDAKYLRQLKEYCNSNRVSDVEFKGHIEGEAREIIFKRASAFVLPTYSENFGNVVAEALIRGLPVITTTGTPWSAITAKRCGWYIEPTLSELKRVLVEATGADPEVLQQMGERGRVYATANFTLPVVRQALLRMYRSTIRSK